MLESVTVETFAPHVGSTFRIVPSAGPAIEAELAEARVLGTLAPAAPRQPFSVIFSGPLTPILPQRIYRVEHPVVAPMDVFLVPIGPDGGRMRYEAIFS